MYDVVIIGWWPAWLTAWIYSSRAMLKTLILEGFMAGGVPAWWQLMFTTHIENFPWFAEPIMAYELMTNMRKQAISNGSEIQTSTVSSVVVFWKYFKVITEDKKEFETKTIILSTWATAKRLKIPWEDIYRQKWISACAVCDGALPIFRDKVLVVIWAGDVACEEAVHLTKYWSKVYMLVRRDQMRASKAMQKKVLENPKIEILRNTEALEVYGDSKIMTKIKITNNLTNTQSELDAWWLFYAIWHIPNTWFLKWIIKLDEDWYVYTNSRILNEYFKNTDFENLSKENYLQKVWFWIDRSNLQYQTMTSTPGIFASGDVADKSYRQAITSAWTGCMASLESEKYIEHNK